MDFVSTGIGGCTGSGTAVMHAAQGATGVELIVYAALAMLESVSVADPATA